MNLPSLGELHHAIVPVCVVAVGHEDRPVVRDDDIGRRVEVIWSVPRHSRLTERHQNVSGRAELDDAVPSLSSFRRSRGADGVGHPHVRVRVDVNSVRPDEHAAAEALDGIAGFNLELHGHV